MPNLAPTFLIKCYWMLQNGRVTTFTVSELFRENQQGGKIPLPSYDPDFEFRTHFLFIRTAAADEKQL